MNNSALFDNLTALLSERFGIPTGEIRPEVKLRSLDLDSLAMVEFGLVAENQYGIRISEDDVSSDDTVADLARLIEDKGGEV
ncbi:acyl carrier protein [Streptomyces sp. NPDC086554]|uniref:acyl carrier protein n=1 Tax=Streptomyces sp. NPDC086554 TaxID=3154864 RepID=UPI0034348B72